jgi:cytochrome b5
MAEGAKKLFTQSDVALHASRKDCWVVINGKVRILAEERSSL